MATSPIAQEKEFIGPGLSPFKRIVTIVGVVGIILVILIIAIHQGISAVGSTIVAVLFVLGFVYYLRLIAPVPFVITLTPEMVIKKSRNGETIALHWSEISRIKEEFFPNGTRISVTVYRKVTEPKQKAKAWAVYRDDVTDLDGLAAALKALLPEGCQWQSETVHE
jgi:hypothetical protein